MINYSADKFFTSNQRDQGLVGFALFLTIISLIMQIIFSVYTIKRLKRRYDTIVQKLKTLIKKKPARNIN